MQYSFFWVMPLRVNFIYRYFSTLCSIFVRGVSRKVNLPADTTYEDGTECTETSLHKIQKPGILSK